MLKTGRAATAERQLRAIQAAAPGEVNSLHLLGAALLDQDKVTAAIEMLERAVAAAPQLLAGTHRPWPAPIAAAGRLEEAREELATRRCGGARCSIARGSPTEMCWSISRNTRMHGSPTSARGSAIRKSAASMRHASALVRGRSQDGRSDLSRYPASADASHVAALCGLAAVSLTASRPQDAVRLLQHALKQSAHLPLAWRGLSQALVALGALPEAEAAVRHLLKIEGENPKIGWCSPPYTRASCARRTHSRPSRRRRG